MRSGLQATSLAVVVVAAAAAFHAPLLTAAASYLDKSEAPQHADLVYVLAGDYSGHRILKGSELVREGFAPKVVVSGPEGFYGHYECDLAIPFAEQHGYPADYFIRFPNTALSTREEAAAAVPELRRLGAHRVLLVTSLYHTRRAGSLFRAAAPDLQFTVVSASDIHFTKNGWWHDREGRKTFLIEWLKTVAGWFRI